MSNLTNQEVIEACEGTACFECDKSETCRVFKALYDIELFMKNLEDAQSAIMSAGIKTDDPVKFMFDKYYNGNTKGD